MISLILTIITTSTAGLAIMDLYNDIQQDIYIQGSELHSLQHLAIFGGCMLLSIVMFINWSLLLEHIFFNLFCIFIIFPHLISER